MEMILNEKWGFVPVHEFMFSFIPKDEKFRNNGDIDVTIKVVGFDLKIKSIVDGEGYYSRKIIREVRKEVQRMIDNNELTYPNGISYEFDDGIKNLDIV